MRVLHVMARLNVGGTAKYLANLLPDLEQNGFEVLLAVGHVEGDEIEDDFEGIVKVVRIPSLNRSINLRKDFQAYRCLRKIIAEFHPDVIHSHTFKAGLISRTQVKSNKFVHTFHGHLFDDPGFSKLQIRFIEVIEKFLALRSDRLISVGERVSQELVRHGVGDVEQYTNIPPGIDTLIKLPRKVALKNLGLQDSTNFRIGWLARMTSVKNPLLFVEISKQFPGIEFIMGGGGDLLEKVRVGVPENLKLLGWVDSTSFLNSIDILVSTSSNEGIPVALIEAQMLGVPVVATNVGGVSEVIKDQVTGFLCSEDKNDLIEKIQLLCEDPTKMAEMSSYSAKHSQSKFSKNHMVLSHVELYNDLKQ